MTNTIAIWLALFILGLVAVDIVLFGHENMIFLARKFLLIIDYLAFWR